jgi:hypothetical protein
MQTEVLVASNLQTQKCPLAADYRSGGVLDSAIADESDLDRLI